MVKLHAYIFGDLRLPYPSIEIYVDDALRYEIITGLDGSVEVFPARGGAPVSEETVASILQLALPVWRDAIAGRETARAIKFDQQD